MNDLNELDEYPAENSIPFSELSQVSGMMVKYWKGKQELFMGKIALMELPSVLSTPRNSSFSHAKLAGLKVSEIKSHPHNDSQVTRPKGKQTT